MDKFLTLTIIGRLHRRHLRHRGQRARPHLHDDRHLQLRPRRDRACSAPSPTGSSSRRGLGLAGAHRRCSSCCSSSAPLLGVAASSVGIMRGLARTRRRRSEARRLHQPPRRAPRAGPVDLARRTSRTRSPLFFDGQHRSASSTSNVTWHDLIALRAWRSSVAIGLRLLLYRTRAGLDMRASVDDRPLATLHGARPDRSAMLAWAIGCSLAAAGRDPHRAGADAQPHRPHAAHRQRVRRRHDRAAAQPAADVPRRGDPRARRLLRHRLPPDRRTSTSPASAPAIPVILLFIVLILLPSARLRGQSAVRTREVVPRVSWRGDVPRLRGRSSPSPPSSPSRSASRTPQTLLALFGVGLIALSLVPLVGYAGQISLCQMSFAAIGAIAMAYHGGGGNRIGLVLAAVIAGAGRRARRPARAPPARASTWRWPPARSPCSSTAGSSSCRPSTSARGR